MSTQPIGYPGTPTLVAPVNRPSFSWSGIFAGTFLFLAIEATFGILGAAVFASAANPNAANPVGTGITIGAGIWMVVLSIIALYFAGKLSSKLSGAMTRNIGMYNGLVTFGMCVFASVLMTAMTLSSTIAGSTGIRYIGNARFVDILATGGYWMFVALILGMISAAFGGMHGTSTGGRTPMERGGEAEKRRAA